MFVFALLCGAETFSQQLELSDLLKKPANRKLEVMEELKESTMKVRVSNLKKRDRSEYYDACVGAVTTTVIYPKGAWPSHVTIPSPLPVNSSVPRYVVRQSYGLDGRYEVYDNGSALQFR